MQFGQVELVWGRAGRRCLHQYRDKSWRVTDRTDVQRFVLMHCSSSMKLGRSDKYNALRPNSTTVKTSGGFSMRPLFLGLVSILGLSLCAIVLLAQSKDSQ